jgi:hypothetical protein
MWFQDRPCARARKTASRSRASSARTASAAFAIARRSSVPSTWAVSGSKASASRSKRPAACSISLSLCRVIGMSSEELVELRSQRVSVDDDGVVAVDIEDSDLQQCSVGGRSDEHDQVVVQVYAPHSVSDRVPYVRVRDLVLSRWRTDPHLDNIACLADMSRPGYGGPHGPSCMPPYHGARSRLPELVDRALITTTSSTSGSRAICAHSHHCEPPTIT